MASVNADRDLARRYLDRVAARIGAASRLEMRAQGSPAGCDPADLVVVLDCADGGPWPDAWEERLSAWAKLARRALVVIVENPERLSVRRGRDGPRQTLRLAPVLWSIGRVREHAYLGISPAVAALEGLRRHDGAVGEVVCAPVGMFVRRSARLHAFLVDTTPRSPQARRRLRVATEGSDAAG